MNKVSTETINKFKTLPLKIDNDNKSYDLNIVATWYSTDSTFYNFELNYYCTKDISFLFKYVISKDVNISINNLVAEINKLNAKAEAAVA